MSQTSSDDLLTALMFQNMAEKYLEYVKHEASSDGKAFVGRLISRLQANRNDCYAKITTEKGRQAFLREFSQKDTLQYANIFLAMINLSEKDRDTIEKVVEQIAKGGLIEYVEQPISQS
jgi:hypothetical protein